MPTHNIYSRVASATVVFAVLFPCSCAIPDSSFHPSNVLQSGGWHQCCAARAMRVTTVLIPVERVCTLLLCVHTTTVP